MGPKEPDRAVGTSFNQSPVVEKVSVSDEEDDGVPQQNPCSGKQMY